MKLLKWLGIIALVAVSLCVTVFAVSYLREPKECPVCHNKGIIYERCPKCQGWGEIRKVCPSCGGKGWTVTMETIVSRRNYSGDAREALNIQYQYESQWMSGSLTQEQGILRGEYEVKTMTCTACEGKGWVVETCPLCHGDGYLVHPCPRCSKNTEVKFIRNPEPQKVQIHQTFNINVGGENR